MGFINNFINKRINEYINKELETAVDPSAVIIKDETFDELENRIWYEAKSASELETFYKTNFKVGSIAADTRLFYRKVKGKSPRVHVPVSKTITETVVNLVFSESPVLTVETKNQKKNKELNKEIQETLVENNSEDLFKQVAAMVSYSGACGVKLTLDSEISDRVIAQAYPKEDIIVERRYGRVVCIKFKDYFNDGYVLYTVDKPGIRSFELFQNGKPAKLSELEETKNLHEWYLVNAKGEAMNSLMSVYVENINGKSDYDGCIDLFHLLDEIKSAMTHIQRSLKPKRGIPSSLCEIDRESGKAVIPDDWDREETIIEVQDPESQIKSLNEMSFASPDFSSYQELYDRTFKDILNKVSLSESTLGNNDGGSDASSLALNIREKSSLRKRASLILKYDRALRELTRLILVLNNAKLSNNTLISDDFKDYDYFVSFSEYNSPSFDQIVESLAKALDAGLISQREAIRELYKGDMSEEEQEEMIAEINKTKAENQKQFEEKKQEEVIEDEEVPEESME